MKNIIIKKTLLLMLVVMLILSACSSKGVRMPKHRKRSHCDCPTFSYKSVTGD